MRVVIPATPGSNTDIFFRIIAPKMGAMLGQQFVADYRAGAGGVIGAANTIRSAPDGYTIAMIAAGFVMNPAIYKKLPVIRCAISRRSAWSRMCRQDSLCIHRCLRVTCGN